MNWKEQLRENLRETDHSEAFKIALEHFIYTKIIERMLAEIPREVTGCLYADCVGKCSHLAVAEAKFRILKNKLRKDWI